VGRGLPYHKQCQQEKLDKLIRDAVSIAAWHMPADVNNEADPQPGDSKPGAGEGETMDTVYNIEKVLATGRNNRTQHINDLDAYRSRVSEATIRAATTPSVMSNLCISSVRSAVVLDDLVLVNDCVAVYDRYIQDLEHREGTTCNDCDAVRWLLKPASQCHVKQPHRLRIVVEPGNGCHKDPLHGTEPVGTAPQSRGRAQGVLHRHRDHRY
jgi:hypothetical protein